MVEEEKYCIDILSQIKAVRSAMNQVEIKIMEKHLKHCLHGALMGKDQKEIQVKINELVKVLSKRS